jgi:hypothetical protein
VPASRITFGSAESVVDVQGDLQQVIDELHKVLSRRESTFAVLQDVAGSPIAVRPDAVLHVRPVSPDLPPSA